MTAKKSQRKKAPKPTVAEVLVSFGRRCPLCYGLHSDASVKQGQIAHLDGDRANDDESNLAFLCLAHHDLYDTVTSQSKGIELSEVRIYIKHLKEYVKTMRSGAWPDSRSIVPSLGSAMTARGSTPAEYQLRLPIYIAVKNFLSSIVTSAKVDLESLMKLAAETDQALFLFDHATSDLIGEMYRRAISLRSVGQKMELLSKSGQAYTDELITADYELLTWFTSQLEGLRQHLEPYMHLQEMKGQLTHGATPSPDAT